ncbi:MAG: hypothetical protein F2789_11835, partial [Actinobacteria bacterium]|nr:hypothetical protein [Actinomycetota bacterium]
MRSTIKRMVATMAVVLVGVGATGAGTVGAGVGAGGHVASALGTASLSPSSGTSATTFTLLPPAGASCTGSASGVPAYRWQTYLVGRSVDPSALTFASGPSPVPGAFVSPLFDSVDTPINNRNPSASPTGLISGIPTMSLHALSGTVPVGQYRIGFACTVGGVVEHGNYWDVPITVVATDTAWVTGWAPEVAVIAPVRLLDSRVGVPSTVDGRFWQVGARAAGSVTELVVAGRGGVAVDAAAVVLNVTVTEPQTPGFVTVFPCGSAVPTASNLNFVAGQTVPNAVIAKLGTNGKVCLYTSAVTHLIVD